jgi:hypothetical protein
LLWERIERGGAYRFQAYDALIRALESRGMGALRIRDLPCMKFGTTVVVEVYRVCPDCGVKVEKVSQLPVKPAFSKRFEDAAVRACESAAPRQVGVCDSGWRPAPSEPSTYGAWNDGRRTGKSG